MATCNNNVNEFEKYFEEKITKINELLTLRGLANTTDTVEALMAIDDQVTEIEEMVKGFKEYLGEQRRLIARAEKLENILEVFQQRTENLTSNLPEHLPGRIPSKDSEKIVKEKKDAPSTLVRLRNPKVKSAGNFANSHRMEYLTTEQFDSTPKYLKGRLTYNQINSAVNEINRVLEAKYRILNLPRVKMSEPVMKKFKEFKEQETAETEGSYFFVSKDLKEYSNFKLDKSGQSVLNILRHSGKIKEVRGGKIVRFVIQGSQRL